MDDFNAKIGKHKVEKVVGNMVLESVTTDRVIKFCQDEKLVITNT